MGQIKADIKSVVENIGKNVVFMQPLYETITNSLEANAKNIEIFISEEEKLDGLEYGLMKGFSITDDGDGFNDFNVNGFTTLWTKNKIQLGCKGSGRFTWLNVFSDIHVCSDIKNIKQRREFDFNYDFEEESISKVSLNDINSNKTTITFSGVHEKYKKRSSGGQIYADPNYIKKQIIDFLIVKLFLLKKNSIDFNIALKTNSNFVEITKNDIPDLLSIEFEIKGINDCLENFTMFYYFCDDGKNSKKMYFCASNRCIKENNDDDLKFSCSLPNNTSLFMMVCSHYLDERNGDDRNTFELLDSLKSANILNPITLSQIKKESIDVMNKIILDKFPQIVERNEEETEKAIESAPYLAKYINENVDAIKSSKSLITKACDVYTKEKKAIKEEYSKALADNQIDPQHFNEVVEKMSNIAAIELAEYIFYRDDVIEGLKKGIQNKDTLESFVHNVLISQHKTIKANDISERFQNNIWLFDDKYMTFSYCASEKTINHIVKELYPQNTDVTFKYKRPDIFMAFDKDDNSEKRNSVMIELKGPNAEEDEKNKSITELPNHIAIIRENMPNVETIWGYIVTTIDDKFKRTLDITDGYIPLFSKDKDFRAYYYYYGKGNAHIYVLDLDVVLSDAKLRNQTFMDLIKQK